MQATLTRAEFRADDIPEGHVAVSFRVILANNSPEWQAVKAAVADGPPSLLNLVIVPSK